MATQKDSAEDATILGDSKKSAPSGPNGSAVKSNGSKPNVDEIRTRAYEIFQERLGRNEIGDWQRQRRRLPRMRPRLIPPEPSMNHRLALPADHSCGRHTGRGACFRIDRGCREIPDTESR
jgi:hypothetical protein